MVIDDYFVPFQQNSLANYQKFAIYDIIKLSRPWIKNYKVLLDILSYKIKNTKKKFISLSSKTQTTKKSKIFRDILKPFTFNLLIGKKGNSNSNEVHEPAIYNMFFNDFYY